MHASILGQLTGCQLGDLECSARSLHSGIDQAMVTTDGAKPLIKLCLNDTRTACFVLGTDFNRIVSTICK